MDVSIRSVCAERRSNMMNCVCRIVLVVCCGRCWYLFFFFFHRQRRRLRFALCAWAGGFRRKAAGAAHD